MVFSRLLLFPAFSGLADPFYFFSSSLFCFLLGGLCFSSFFLLLAFGPLGWLLVLSPCPWSSRGFGWRVPTLPSWSVDSPGSPSLALPLRSGVLFPGYPCSCLRFVSVRLPSFPAPQVSYGLVVVSPRWSPHLRVYWFSHPTFVCCGLVICCLSPV